MHYVSNDSAVMKVFPAADAGAADAAGAADDDAVVHLGASCSCRPSKKKNDPRSFDIPIQEILNISDDLHYSPVRWACPLRPVEVDGT